MTAARHARPWLRPGGLPRDLVRAPRLAGDRSRRLERIRRGGPVPRLPATVGVGRGPSHRRLAPAATGDRFHPGSPGGWGAAPAATHAAPRLAPGLRAA